MRELAASIYLLLPATLLILRETTIDITFFDTYVSRLIAAIYICWLTLRHMIIRYMPRAFISRASSSPAAYSLILHFSYLRMSYFYLILGL